jgi:hypothetical protein
MPHPDAAPLPVAGRDDQKAQTAAMIGAHNYRLFTYLQPYDLRREEERAALAAVYLGEFDTVCPVTAPGDAPVRYLFVIDGRPALVPEADVPPFVFGIALGKLGWEAALAVLYADDLLP